MSLEAWISLAIMAMFNVVSTAFYIGVNKQMLTEVMRRVANIENEKATKESVILQIESMESEQDRLDREVSNLRHDLKTLLQRGMP
jgi:hypothetical protein